MIQVLYRITDSDSSNEYEICKQYFDTVTCRTIIQPSKLVVGRYSVLPFYNELVKDIHNYHSELINSVYEHNYIANFDWYWDVTAYTPQSWFDYDFYQAPNQAYVVKGRTNSRKQKWSTEMYASNKQNALEIANTLSGDSLIGKQGIVYRKYEELECFDYGLNGLPFANEWRIFCCQKQMLSCDYYWTISDYIPKDIPIGLMDFAQHIANILSSKCTFFVLDIAKKKNGDWILIEVNDGQMSGCSNPHKMYYSLKEYLNAVKI